MSSSNMYRLSAAAASAFLLQGCSDKKEEVIQPGNDGVLLTYQVSPGAKDTTTLRRLNATNAATGKDIDPVAAIKASVDGCDHYINGLEGMQDLYQKDAWQGPACVSHGDGPYTID